MSWPSTIEDVDELAREVYISGLTHRYATLYAVYGRMVDNIVGPKRVSEACKRLVALGWAEVSVMGYRRRQVVQPSLAGDGVKRATLR